MRTLCPLFTWAGDLATYATRVAELQAGDVAVVVSSRSGPGQAVDPSLMQHIADLSGGRVDVLGYIHIDEAGRGRTRTIDAVLDDIEAWHRFYGVTRLFVDEWPADWGLRYIGAVWGATRGYSGKGTIAKPILVINPGQPLELRGTLPDGVLIVTHEGTDTVPAWSPQPWEAVIVHDSADPVATRARLAANGWAWGYVTSDGSDGNPYDEKSTG